MFHLIYFIAMAAMLIYVPQIALLMLVAWPFVGMDLAKRKRQEAQERREKEQLELLRKLVKK